MKRDRECLEEDQGVRASQHPKPTIEVGKVIIRNEFYDREDKSWKHELKKENA